MTRFFSLFAAVAIFLSAQSAQANNLVEFLTKHDGREATEAVSKERFVLDWNTSYASNYNNSVASYDYDAGSSGSDGIKIIGWDTSAGIRSSITAPERVKGIWNADPAVPYSAALWSQDWTLLTEPKGAAVDFTRGKTRYFADGRRSDPADAGDLLLSMAPLNKEGLAFVKGWGSKDIGVMQGDLAVDYFAKLDPADAGVLLEPM